MRFRNGILALCLTATFVNSGSGAWQPVIEDSTDVGLEVASLVLDTTHFAQPTLIVGTLRDSMGLGHVMSVDPVTLELLDTIYSSTSVPNVCRAADLNGDSIPDLLIGLTSGFTAPVRFFAVVALYGPDFDIADTLVLPRPLADLVVDESKGEIWMGYRHDTTIVVQFGCTDYTSQFVGFGGAFDYSLVQTQYLDADRAGVVFTRADVNSDGAQDLVMLWLNIGRFYSSGCGAAPYGTWSSAGAWKQDGAQVGVEVQNWIDFGHYWDDYNDIQPHAQLPVADFDLDGQLEAVLSWQHRKLRGGFPIELHEYIEVRSLADGVQRWKHQLDSAPPGSHGYGPFTAIVYDIDRLAPPELLLIGTKVGPPAPYYIHAFQGVDGDSLFATEFRAVSALNVVLPVSQGEPSRIIHASTNWLYRWRIDLTSSVNDGSESVIPNRFLLRANAPNPFNADTRISYTLATPMEIELAVFDVLGRRVRTLVNSHQPMGDYSVPWDGTSGGGEKLTSGIYFARLSSDGDYVVRKMALVK